MAVISYKCPNCGGEMIFDPESQQYKCEYCVSYFTQEALDALNPAKSNETEERSDGVAAEKDTEAAEETQEAYVYKCPSCGAELVTDATTAATFCYYCHNPVVLEGRVSGEYLPEEIIPFQITKKEAEEKFLEYVGKKKFVPRAFFDKSQIEKLSGIYFPYWMCDCKTEAELTANATKIRTWRSGDTQYTETSFYDIERSGKILLERMTKNALNNEHRLLVEGVQPYRFGERKKFSMGFLSGFQAEKRNMEREAFADEMRKEIHQYSEAMLSDTIQHYNSVMGKKTRFGEMEQNWKYVMLPAWVLTYKGRNNEVYYYAMNGQTGKVWGRLPIDNGKVATMCAAIFGVAAVLGLLAGYLI